MYRIREFAKLAGVTVKALHHYDRLGLLRPTRSKTGYRVYLDRDLERLEQIVALKFIGLSLKQIKTLLDRGALDLQMALRLQRAVLEEKRRQLDRALDAIRNAEKATDRAALRKIIEVIEMQNSTEFMKNYYREEAWALFQERHPMWPSNAWRELFHDVEAALGEDPAGEKAQALAMRWRDLRVGDGGGDPRVHAGLLKAWRDRGYWPESVRAGLSEFHFDEISKFIAQAFRAWRKKLGRELPLARQLERFTPQERDRWPLACVGLYFNIAESLNEDPRSEKAQVLAARWMELMESGTGACEPKNADYQKLIQWMQAWPEDFQREIAALDLERISGFALKVMAASAS